MSTNLRRISSALHPVHSLADNSHLTAIELEVAEVDDRLVAELDRAEPGLCVCLSAFQARAHDCGRPGVPVRLFKPHLNRGPPRFRIANGVSTCQAHAEYNSVRHDRFS